MRFRKCFLFTVAFAVMLMPFGVAHGQGARDGIVRIVRLLGYGGGIHHFKNFVLRDVAEYGEAAKHDFTQALSVIRALQGADEFDAQDQMALDGIKEVVEAYRSAVDRMAELRGKGWRTEDLDRTVIIDDAPAKNGFDRLRAKWPWSDFEEIEFQFGYGMAVHNFKNYVLRGQERYHTGALHNLLTIDALIARQLDVPELRDPRIAAEAFVDAQAKVKRQDVAAFAEQVRKLTGQYRRDRLALEALERAVRAYRDNLGLINKLIAMQRPARQIDEAIKIYDRAGKAGLTHLRQASAYLHRASAQPFEH